MLLLLWVSNPRQTESDDRGIYLSFTFDIDEQKQKQNWHPTDFIVCDGASI